MIITKALNEITAESNTSTNQSNDKDINDKDINANTVSVEYMHTTPEVWYFC